MRDQGLTRPRVLIVVPFRDAALRIVNILIKLLQIEGAPQHVSHKKRFEEEYSELEPYENKLILPGKKILKIKNYVSPSRTHSFKKCCSATTTKWGPKTDFG